ncbi:Pyridoxal phosphate phosphatase YigL [Mesoplasma sp. JKS002660]|uniref:Cof-type HAD-IIB family hydrolase n=1 Tax=Mesoplasma whartonense TaxID=2878854 RepID=UPI002022B277|nr:Cof-type HAD-IIB family hydrolase [Mesoplasma sp. JKS002660]MCL8213715.1 Pyridoxal phosphate phosphatase YigL [Mesoplasma sp. JKS002660]
MGKYEKEALFFSDLDSTLLQDNGFFSAYTKEVVEQIYEEGYLLIPITARSTGDVMRQAKRLKIDVNGGIIGANNGSQLFDFKNQVWIINESLSTEVLKWVFEHTHGVKDMKVHFFSDDTTFVYAIGANSQYWAQIMGSDYIVIDSHQALEQKINHLTIALPKSWTLEQYQEFFTIISTQLKELGADVHKYSDRVLEIAPKNVSKGYAVKKALEYLQVDRHQTKTYAFGDGYNDLSMFDAVDVGVVVENAALALKDVADDATDSNMDDGVANYLATRFLKNKPSKEK